MNKRETEREVKKQAKLALWKVETLNRILQYSNAKLLEDTLSLAGGDDYDGCYTQEGEWEYCALRKLLELRLGTWLEKSLEENWMELSEAEKAVEELFNAQQEKDNGEKT